MGFLRRVCGLTLMDKVKSADIREPLSIANRCFPDQKDCNCAGMAMFHQWSWNEQLQNFCAQHRLVEGLQGVTELNGGITLKILLGFALASHQPPQHLHFVEEDRDV